VDFELSEEQELLRSGLRDLLDRGCDPRRVRTVAYDGDGRDRDLWRQLVEAGWTALTIPDADGGADLHFEDMALVAAEAGRAALPLPLTATLLVSRAVARAPAGQFRSYALSRIRTGESSATLALRAAASANGDQDIVAERDGRDWCLSGTAAFVPYGPLAHLVLVEAAREDGGRALFVTTASDDDASWASLDAVDKTMPLYELTLDRATVPAGCCLLPGEDAGPAIERLIDEWRTAIAAETLGACERLLEMSVAYAKERMQFDRPIGANQAVKARIAEMAANVERMRAAVYHAAVKIDADAEDRPLAVAMAKAATAAPGAFVASQAIHVHGGIGYTWEHDVHFYFKRIKSNELLLGDSAASLARVADAVL
jgi:alkylation response protein AidB-like acyl-CoA dehydrogenase